MCSAFQPLLDGKDYGRPKAHSLRRVLVCRMFHGQTPLSRPASCPMEQPAKDARAWEPAPPCPTRSSAQQVASRCEVKHVIVFTHKVGPTLHLNSQHRDCSRRSGEDSPLREGKDPQIFLKKPFHPCLSLSLRRPVHPETLSLFSRHLCPRGLRRQGPNLHATAEPPSHSQEVLPES